MLQLKDTLFRQGIKAYVEEEIWQRAHPVSGSPLELAFNGERSISRSAFSRGDGWLQSRYSTGWYENQSPNADQYGISLSRLRILYEMNILGCGNDNGTEVLRDRCR